jgi:single-stranded-DNA-specific exonuclease
MAENPHKWIPRKSDFEDLLQTIEGYCPVFSRLLLSRGLDSKDRIDEFLNPSLRKMHDPFLMPGMAAAVSRFKKALEGDENIWIFGDYDADGIISSALLYNFLGALGLNPDVYIPDRTSEGYDLNQDFLESVTGKADLVICVDCGTNSSAPREYVMDNTASPGVIACDHHNPAPCSYNQSERYIVVNPKLPGTVYPFRELSGAGVTFKFMTAVLRSLDAKKKKCFSSDYLNSLLDLVAVSTLADLMPLKDENRILVSYGLKRICRTSNPGLRKLMELSLPDASIVGEYDIGFIIAPRLNAAGRVKDAMDSFRLLCYDNDDNESIAGKLDMYNIQRQERQKEILDEIMDKYAAAAGLSGEKIFIKYSDSWEEGILGIVASDMVKVLNMPVILFREKDGLLKGSGRSIKEFSLHRSLGKTKDLFTRFGGHDLACGITMELKDFDEFLHRMNEMAGEVLTDEDLVKKYMYDIEISFDEIDDNLIRDIDMLRPFGMENPAPSFVTRGCMLEGIKRLKQGLHAKMFLKKDGIVMEGILFNISGDKDALLYPGNTVDILYDLSINLWMGRRSIQLKIRDLF